VNLNSDSHEEWFLTRKGPFADPSRTSKSIGILGNRDLEKLVMLSIGMRQFRGSCIVIGLMRTKFEIKSTTSWTRVIASVWDRGSLYAILGSVDQSLVISALYNKLATDMDNI
jgi:hypothetical protein